MPSASKTLAVGAITAVAGIAAIEYYRRSSQSMPVYLDPAGQRFYRWRTFGDGDCLFVALWCGLELAEGRPFHDPLTSQQARLGARVMRQKTVEYLQSNKRVLAKLQHVIWASYKQSTDEYLEDMRGKAYGDQLMLVAWQRLYRVGVQAYDLSDGVLHFAGDPVKQPARVFILNDYSNLHFELLTPAPSALACR